MEVDVGRTAKPRQHGITLVIDTGHGPARIDDLAAAVGPYCDYAKVAWVSALATPDLAAKLERYRGHGITPLLGGSLFEYAFLWGKLDALVDLVRASGAAIEVSDGVVKVPRRDKLAWIEKLAAHAEVFSELGGKPERQDLDWPRCIKEELSAGAQHIVIEGRELGPPGQDLRDDLVDIALGSADPHVLVFEALERYQQVWLIKRLGPNVNLGNIRADDVMTVECFRRGLKEHTMLATHERIAERE